MANNEIAWRKARRSGTGAQSDCVEVAALSGKVAVRDSKDPDGPMLVFRRDVFAALVADLKH